MANANMESVKKKTEGVFSIVSGLSGIASFILDYPNLAFVLVVFFGIATYLYLGSDVKRLLKESKTAQLPKLVYWFKELTSNRLLGVVSLTFVSVTFLTFQFAYKELGFVLRQGWVEKISYEYQSGMLPVHLVSLNQANRVLRILREINPVIYHGESFNSDDDEISFEEYDYSLTDFDDGSFNIYAAGYDPRNSILEPSGNSEASYLLNGEFKKFPLRNHYTFFVVFVNSGNKQPEYIRLHFSEKLILIFADSSKVRMDVFISYRKSGESRFDGLITP